MSKIDLRTTDCKDADYFSVTAIYQDGDVFEFEDIIYEVCFKDVDRFGTKLDCGYISIDDIYEAKNRLN